MTTKPDATPAPVVICSYAEDRGNDIWRLLELTCAEVQ
jgi:hypothetical protein